MPAFSTTLLNSTNVRYTAAGWLRRARMAVTAALVPQRAAETAARLFSTPPRFAHPERERELLTTGTRYTVASRHGEIAAWRFGRSDRPTVVLSHGWGGRGAQLGPFVPALLEAGYSAVLFDHAGHGCSDGSTSTLVHFWHGLEAVVAHTEGRGAEVVAAVGHSLGAAATGLWLNESGRHIRAVAIAPPTSVERHSGHFARQLGIPEPVRRAMQERIERATGRRWAEFELPHAVARVRAELLVIHDEDDREVPYASGLALARSWKDARLVATRGLGHRRILRAREVVQDAVDFIADRVVFPPPPACGEERPYGAPAPIA